jgi:hypothetical protein
MKRVTGVEPATLCLASTRSSQLSYTRVGKSNCNTARRSVNGNHDSEKVQLALNGSGQYDR